METGLDLQRFGELLADLPPMIVTESSVAAAPPGGAGRLIAIEGTKFKWEPVSEVEWRALSPEQRAEIVIHRGAAWLEQNGDIAAAPVAFVNPSAMDESAEYLFGEAISTLKEAICATYRLMHSNQARAENAVLGLSMTLLLVTGLLPPGAAVGGIASQFLEHLPAMSPHIVQALIVNYAQRFCVEK